MITILKIDASNEIVRIQFRFLPRKKKIGSLFMSQIAEALVENNMSIEASISPEWIYESAQALERVQYKVEYFEILYVKGKLNLAAYASKRTVAQLVNSNNKSRVRSLSNRIRLSGSRTKQ